MRSNGARSWALAGAELGKCLARYYAKSRHEKQSAIGRAQEIYYERLRDKLPPNQQAKVYYFSLAPAEVPLPLGWMLSNQAARAMHLELNDQGKSKHPSVPTWNKAVREQIIASLPPRAVPAVSIQSGSAR
jgi:hypothetical protein